MRAGAGTTKKESEQRALGPGSLRYRYCPLESGEPIEVTACATCPHNPPAPFHICFAPRPARPRRRGFWDREEPPG